MGLPQVSPSTADEVATSLSTLVSVQSRLGGIGSFNLEGLHVGSTSSWSSSDFPCPSIGDFHSKTTLELPKGGDAPFKCKNAIDGAASFQGLKLECKEKKGWLMPKVGQDAQRPVMRIVGFESSHQNSIFGLGKAVSDEINGVDSSDNLAESNGSQARKRLLSPLNGMLQKHFHGDLLDIGGTSDVLVNSDDMVRRCMAQLEDCKKANISCVGNSDALVHPNSRGSPWTSIHEKNRFSSGVFTDEKNILSQQRIDGFLAVLNVSCGITRIRSFFVAVLNVSCGIDGDNSLLYYAAIDLAVSSPSNKSKSQKLKRSLSIDESHAFKSRLRIPMKGRIQLLLCEEFSMTVC